MMKTRAVNVAFVSVALLLLGAGAADAETEDFRIAVIGDSVMWGEGLHDLQKISTKVEQYLQNHLGGRVVRLQHRAHCGAVIGPVDLALEEEAARAGMQGELPRDLPSISYQAARQVVEPGGIDLVLMNGGINDVGVKNIMDTSLDINVLGDAIWAGDQGMAQRMVRLLRDVAERSPDATIVVTNYYPVISHESNPTLAWGIFRFALGDLPFWDDLRRDLASRWHFFHEQSTAALRWAVTEVNRDYPGRVRFVASGFGPENAVGASAPWLYDADDIDPVDYWRKAICDAHDPNILCYRANTGHPNRYGAEAYAAAILQEISPLIPGWRAQNTPKTLALRVVTNSMSGASISITVYASDAISGAPLSGTVSINGVSGPTGSRISYRRCLATEDGKVPYEPCPGQVLVDGYEEAAFAR